MISQCVKEDGFFYILDIIFKEFDLLPNKDSNLCRRIDYFPDHENLRNLFNWHQDDINQRNKYFMMLSGLQIAVSEYMKPDVVYSAEDLEFSR